MPLKAVCGDTTFIAPLLSDEQWQRLRSDVKAKRLMLRMPCCQAAAFPRESKLGTRHFYHKPGVECDAKGETLEHLLAKAHVAIGARDAGYEVDTEASGDGWRADVLAKKGQARVAFEIQWSAQSLEDTVYRQERYAAAGVRCAWLFRKLPPKTVPTRDLPMFQLNFERRELPTAAGLPLRQFTAALLGGQFKFCASARAMDRQPMTIQFFNYKCWRCHKSCHAYRVTNHVRGLVTQHGNTIADLDDAFREPIEYCPQVLEAVRQFQRAAEGSQIRLGQIKRRYSGTREQSDMSQGCPACDILFSDFYLQSEPDSFTAPVVAELDITVTLLEPVLRDQPHWCYSPTKEFCC